MSRFKTETPLSNIAKRPRFLFLDGVTVAPLLLVMAAPSLTTFLIMLSISLSLYMIEQRGMPVPVFLRRLRTTFVGRRRYLRPPWRNQ